MIVVIVFLGFTKDIPFTTPYEVSAVFESANSIRPGSPVRIAGVDVGKVKEVEADEGTDAAVVVLQIDDEGLPLHADATAKIRPRIFLEGNFFVDLKPGSPEAPELEDGGTLKVTQTATPVQLDQVLTSLQSDTRQDLKDVLDGLAVALNSEPTAAEDRDADPSTRGETAAESFNDAYDDIPEAERSTAHGARGVPRHRARPGPLAADRRHRAHDRRADPQRERAARADHELQHDDGGVRLRVRQPADARSASCRSRSTSANRALASLNAAFPSTRAFAREIIPGVRETPATIEAALPWIDQARPLMGPRELGGVAAELAPASQDLARLTDRLLDLLPQTDLASKCARDIVLPAGDVVIEDEFTTGVENYKEFFYTLVGLSGEGQNFDGNGMMVRFQPGGGTQSVTLGSNSSSTGQLFGNSVAVPLGNRPFYPGKRSPYRPTAQCYKQTPPNLNGPAAAKSDPTGQAALASSKALSELRAKLRPFGSKKDGDK